MGLETADLARWIENDRPRPVGPEDRWCLDDVLVAHEAFGHAADAHALKVIIET